MSINQVSTLPPLPSTTRTVPVHLSYDKVNDKLCYCSGKSIFITPFDPTARDPIIQFAKHNAPTTVAKFSPSGSYIASGDEHGFVKVWDCLGEDLILKYEAQIISGRINDLSWDADSQRIIAVGNGKEKFGHCFTWDSGNSIGEISGHSSQINSVSIKPNRPYRAITASDDAAIVFMQGPPFKFNQSLRGHHTNFVKSAQFSPNGEFFISCGSDRKLFLYEGKNGDFIAEIDNDHQGGIYGVAWFDNETVVTCSADSSVKLFNVNEKSLVKTWQLPKKLENQLLGVVVAGEKIVTLALNGYLYYFDKTSETPLNVIEGHQKSITSLKYIQSSKSIISGSYDGRIINWNLDTKLGTEVIESDTIAKHSNLIVSIVETANDVYTVGWDDCLKKISNSTKTAASCFSDSVDLQTQPKRLCVYDEDKLIVAKVDSLTIYDQNLKEVSNELKLDFEITPAIACSSAHIIVCSAETNEVFVYDAKKLSLVTKLPTPLQSKPNVAAISPNGQFLAVGDSMGKILLYNLENFTVQTSRWSFHTAKINSIAWSSDNDHVVSGSLDTNIIVYSVSKPSRNVKFVNAHKDGVNAVDWIDEQKFVSGGTDGALKLWTI